MKTLCVNMNNPRHIGVRAHFYASGFHGNLIAKHLVSKPSQQVLECGYTPAQIRGGINEMLRDDSKMHFIQMLNCTLLGVFLFFAKLKGIYISTRFNCNIMLSNS